MAHDPNRDEQDRQDINVDVHVNEDGVRHERGPEYVDPVVEPASVVTIRFLVTLVIFLIILLIIVLLATGVIPSS